MKQFAALSLSALFAVAAAIPLEKRDYYTTTVVEEVTDIVDVYTTVFVPPGDPRLTQGVLTSSVPAATVTTPAAQTSQTSAAAVVPQPQAQQKEEAHVQAPAPTSTPVVVPTSTPVPSTTPLSTYVPQVAAVAPVSSAPAPVSSSAAPAPAPSPASGSSSSGSSAPTGGDCATGGKCVASDITTFDGTVGTGACGKMDSEYSDNYVALTHGQSPLRSNSLASKLSSY